MFTTSPLFLHRLCFHAPPGFTLEFRSPIFCYRYSFAASVSENISEKPLLWTLLIVHLLLYPASNGYNSYFEKDEKEHRWPEESTTCKKGFVLSRDPVRRRRDPPGLLENQCNVCRHVVGLWPGVESMQSSCDQIKKICHYKLVCSWNISGVVHFHHVLCWDQPIRLVIALRPI